MRHPDITVMILVGAESFSPAMCQPPEAFEDLRWDTADHGLGNLKACFAKGFASAKIALAQQNKADRPNPLASSVPMDVATADGEVAVLTVETPARTPIANAFPLACGSGPRPPTPASAARSSSEITLVATPTAKAHHDVVQRDIAVALNTKFQSNLLTSTTILIHSHCFHVYGAAN